MVASYIHSTTWFYINSKHLLNSLIEMTNYFKFTSIKITITAVSLSRISI